MSMAQTFSTETRQWLIVAELFQYLSYPQSSGFTSSPLFLSASRPMGFRNFFFFFCIAIKKSDLIQFPLISFLSGLLFSWHYKGLNLSDLISLSFIWITNILISFWSRFLSIGLLQMAAAAISVYNLMTSWRLRLVITI